MAMALECLFHSPCANIQNWSQKRAKETKAKALTEEGGKEIFAFDSFGAY